MGGDWAYLCGVWGYVSWVGLLQTNMLESLGEYFSGCSGFVRGTWYWGIMHFGTGLKLFLVVVGLYVADVYVVE